MLIRGRMTNMLVEGPGRLKVSLEVNQPNRNIRD